MSQNYDKQSVDSHQSCSTSRNSKMGLEQVENKINFNNTQPLALSSEARPISEVEALHINLDEFNNVTARYCNNLDDRKTGVRSTKNQKRHQLSNYLTFNQSTNKEN